MEPTGRDCLIRLSAHDAVTPLVPERFPAGANGERSKNELGPREVEPVLEMEPPPFGLEFVR
jgi:hypothetical protein